MRLKITGTGWILTALVLMAVVVRIGYVWNLPTDELRWSDEREFDKIGWRLASTGRYESIPYRATPAFPCFLAAVYRVAGHSYRAARVAQSVLAGLLVLAVYGIGASLFGRVTGMVAAGGVALYPPLIYLSGVFYAEHLYAVLLAGAVYCLVKWWETKRIRWVAIVGVVLGLGALCRPVCLVFVPVAAGYAGWSGRGRWRWGSAAILLGVVCLTVAPWTIRNAMAYHHFLPISTGLGLHLWRGNDDVSRGDADDRFLFPDNGIWTARVKELPTREQRNAARREVSRIDDAMTRITVLGPAGSFDEEALKGFYALKPDSSLTEGTGSEADSAIRKKVDLVELDGVFLRSAEEWMVYHPLDVLRLSARRVVTLYSAFTRSRTPSEDAGRRNRVIAAMSFYPVLALGLIGAVVAWQRQRGSVVLAAAIAAGMAVYVVTTACTRFRLPLDPFWMLLASVTVTSGWQRARDGAAAAWGSLFEKPERPAAPGRRY